MADTPITATVTPLEITSISTNIGPVTYATVSALEVTGLTAPFTMSFPVKKAGVELDTSETSFPTSLAAGIGALELTGVTTPFTYSFNPTVTGLELTSQELIFAPSVFSVSVSPIELTSINVQLFYRQIWAYNAATSALSRYTIPAAKQLVEHDQRLYILTEDKLYENTGDDDAGTNIDCSISTGYIHFNTEELKRFAKGSIYISYDSDNAGELTLYNSTDGVTNVDQYTTTIAATYPEYFRPALWDGKKARYWKFRLSNTGGADFKVEDWSVHPYAVGRRIK